MCVCRSTCICVTLCDLMWPCMILWSKKTCMYVDLQVWPCMILWSIYTCMYVDLHVYVWPCVTLCDAVIYIYMYVCRSKSCVTLYDLVIYMYVFCPLNIVSWWSVPCCSLLCIISLYVCILIALFYILLHNVFSYMLSPCYLMYLITMLFNIPIICSDLQAGQKNMYA